MTHICGVWNRWVSGKMRSKCFASHSVNWHKNKNVSANPLNDNKIIGRKIYMRYRAIIIYSICFCDNSFFTDSATVRHSPNKSNIIPDFVSTSSSRFVCYESQSQQNVDAPMWQRFNTLFTIWRQTEKTVNNFIVQTMNWRRSNLFHHDSHGSFVASSLVHRTASMVHWISVRIASKRCRRWEMDDFMQKVDVHAREYTSNIRSRKRATEERNKFGRWNVIQLIEHK